MENDGSVIPLTDDEKLKCEGPVTKQEAKSVIKDMKNNKSPGTDGFPVEFYKFFWLDIGKLLINSLNESFDKGHLSLTQRQSIITCIPKGNKPREFMNNKRPISLLNIDYKILSGILAHRLKNVLPKVIGDTQKGFLKNRYIGENIRLVYDIMSELNVQNRKGLLLLLDFEKAFDSLEWHYIKNVLQKYNFGKSFITWFNTLYSGACSCVINNGIFSEFFELERGCRQGDPLSPYIFILAIEPLARAILMENDITGIMLWDKMFKVGQYADDTFLLLDGTEKSLNSSLDLFNSFYKCSGLKLNFDKTSAVWLGTMKGSKEILCPELNLSWTDTFMLLGISFHTDLETMTELNYNAKVTAIEKILQSYGKRRLSLIGKITVIKTLAIPKLVYAMKVLPSPSKGIIDRLNKLFKSFIWKEGKTRIILSQLEQDISNGGLRLTNISFLNNALKISWIPDVIKGNKSLGYIFQNIVNYDKHSIWFLDTCSLQKFLSRVNNSFWSDVLKAWRVYKIIFEKDINVRTYPLWDTYFLTNTNITTRKLEFQSRNINILNDLLHESGRVMGFEDFKSTFDLNINFVDFYSLTHCLPRSWREDIVRNSVKLRGNEISQPVVTDLLQMKKCCKGTYWKFIDTVSVKRNHRSKWSESLQTPISEEVMSEYYSLNFQCTVETRLRSFQYKILQRILTTNKFLNICKINDNLCYFCNNEIETLEHLFWLCPVTNNFWKEVTVVLKPYIDLNGLLCTTTVLLGIRSKENSRILNHLLNLIKNYIYLIKCVGQNLSISGVIEKIRSTYKIEKNIVIQFQKNKEIMDSKWNLLMPLLE